MTLKKRVRQVSDRVEDFGQAEDGLAGALVHDFCVSAYIMSDFAKGVQGWRVVSLIDLGPEVTDNSLKSLQTIIYAEVTETTQNARQKAIDEMDQRAMTRLRSVAKQLRRYGYDAKIENQGLRIDGDSETMMPDISAALKNTHPDASMLGGHMRDMGFNLAVEGAHLIATPSADTTDREGKFRHRQCRLCPG
jgi:hypothetical protein